LQRPSTTQCQTSSLHLVVHDFRLAFSENQMLAVQLVLKESLWKILRVLLAEGHAD